MAGPKNTCGPENSWRTTSVTIVNRCACCHTQTSLGAFGGGHEKHVVPGKFVAHQKCRIVNRLHPGKTMCDACVFEAFHEKYVLPG